MKRYLSYALILACATALVAPSLGSADESMGTTEAKEGMRVKLKLTPDAKAGYNLHLKTKKFRWAPEHVNGAPRKGEGHAHLYVDGEKVTRLYGPWYYLGSLEAGAHEVKVGLNANDHSMFVHHGKPVEDSVTVNVP